MHRLDGPAIECFDGHKEWYINNKYYTQAEYQVEIEKLNNTAYNDKIVEIDGKKYQLKLVREK